MNVRELPPRQSRKLALFLLLAAIALLASAIAVPAYLLHRHYDEALDAQRDLLARYTRIAATSPSLAGQLDALNTKGIRNFFLESDVPALAASEIQEMIKSIAGKHGGKISSMQIPEHKDDGNFRKVTVNVQMNATIAAVQQIFYALETQRPYLFLDNVSIRSTAWQARQAPALQDPEFLVQLDVTSYAIAKEAKK